MPLFLKLWASFPAFTLVNFSNCCEKTHDSTALVLIVAYNKECSRPQRYWSLSIIALEMKLHLVGFIANRKDTGQKAGLLNVVRGSHQFDKGKTSRLFYFATWFSRQCYPAINGSGFHPSIPWHPHAINRDSSVINSFRCFTVSTLQSLIVFTQKRRS